MHTEQWQVLHDQRRRNTIVLIQLRVQSNGALAIGSLAYVLRVCVAIIIYLFTRERERYFVVTHEKFINAQISGTYLRFFFLVFRLSFSGPYVNNVFICDTRRVCGYVYTRAPEHNLIHAARQEVKRKKKMGKKQIDCVMKSLFSLCTKSVATPHKNVYIFFLFFSVFSIFPRRRVSDWRTDAIFFFLSFSRIYRIHRITIQISLNYC